MGREVAAWVYLDALLGFRGDFGLFLRAADVLSLQERRSIEAAIPVRLETDRVAKKG